jgi:hypothetical protein
MIISFDGMIMRNSAILSNRKETKNKLIGIHLVESDAAIEHLFDQYVKKVSAAANTIDERSFEDCMAEALAPNREHMVYYAKSMKPGVDLCFICAAYNLATVRAHHISSQLWETLQVLGHNGFVVRVVTGDGAQSNVSYFQSKCTIKAKSFIPADVLRKHKLDGDFPIAFAHPVTTTPIFFIADPPHALKKVGSSLEHRVLEWDGFTMSKKMLQDIYDATNAYGGTGSLMPNIKLKDSDFEGNNFLAMNVARAARLMSGTMVKMIDEVCNNPLQYPNKERWAAGTDRVKMFSKLRQLCAHMNQWFDICNGKDEFNPFAKATKNTGPGYVNELLEILSWFNEWESWLRSQPGEYRALDFLTVDAFRSLKSVCYGFASIIYEFCVKQNRVINLSKINQDINEKHMGNNRQNGGGTDVPAQVGCMSGVAHSLRLRLRFLDKGNCTNNAADQRTMIKEQPPLKKLRSKGSRHN